MVLALDILTTTAVLFIVTAGLMVIFGVMKIVNFAHGALLTMGAYASFVVTQLKLNPWLGVPLAIVVGIVVGMLVELISCGRCTSVRSMRFSRRGASAS